MSESRQGGAGDDLELPSWGIVVIPHEAAFIFDGASLRKVALQTRKANG